VDVSLDVSFYDSALALSALLFERLFFLLRFIVILTANPSSDADETDSRDDVKHHDMVSDTPKSIPIQSDHACSPLLQTPPISVADPYGTAMHKVSQTII